MVSVKFPPTATLHHMENSSEGSWWKNISELFPKFRDFIFALIWKQFSKDWNFRQRKWNKDSETWAEINVTLCSEWFQSKLCMNFSGVDMLNMEIRKWKEPHFELLGSLKTQFTNLASFHSFQFCSERRRRQQNSKRQFETKHNMNESVMMINYEKLSYLMVRAYYLSVVFIFIFHNMKSSKVRNSKIIKDGKWKKKIEGNCDKNVNDVNDDMRNTIEQCRSLNIFPTPSQFGAVLSLKNWGMLKSSESNYAMKKWQHLKSISLLEPFFREKEIFN